MTSASKSISFRALNHKIILSFNVEVIVKKLTAPFNRGHIVKKFRKKLYRFQDNVKMILSLI